MNAQTETDMAPFAKMNGLGNQIIVADMRARADAVAPQAAIALARRDAIPFDQIMAIGDPARPGHDFDVTILNSDGSYAQACGNGMRCVVKWLNREDGRDAYRFSTAAGIIEASIADSGLITVDMGKPRFGWEEIPLAEEFGDTTGIELQIGPIDAPVLHTPAVANIGNPHAVFFVNDDLEGYELERFGPLLENHPIFPERANITIARVLSRDHVAIRVWERGAGITQACGSAACATLACAARKNLTDRTATITLPGGDLKIEWGDDDRLRMTGPAEFEFDGAFDPQTGEFVRHRQEERAS